MDEENNPMEDSCEVEFVCGDPKVDIRVGDEYQAEIPPMMSESKRAVLLLNPLTMDLDSDSSCSFVVGLPVEVMWIDTKFGDGDDNFDMRESDRNPGSKQWMNLEALPKISSSSWEDFEVDGFVLGLYTFGKNFTQVNKLLESKGTGEILSFYYGEFYKSAKYKIWSNSFKKRSRKCIQGNKLYSGWRLQQLLSRLIPSVPDESQEKKLVNVSKSFAQGKTSLEEYISAVKELVGLRSLVKAVAIGKYKEDLTVLTQEPVKAKQWFTISSAAAAGSGAYTSLTSNEIIEKLTGGSRLSKARCNDIFWEAVWPRLLARGWHSEQSNDRGYIKSKDHIVFLVPGVKKFSRRKLVKQNHYFDSISDILKKVVSEPELLEFETAEIRPFNGLVEENISDQSNKKQQRYLRSPDSSSTHMKFNVVDTTSLASGGKLCALRDLKTPNPKCLVSQSKAFQGDDISSAERFRVLPLDVDKCAKVANECKWETSQMKKLVDEPMRFLIVDTSVDHGLQSSGLRRRRHLPGDENLCKICREGLCDSSHQPGTNIGVDLEYPNGTDSGVKEETLEHFQQGRSKKRSARKSESNSFIPLPKRRRLSACVRKDIKRSGESSVMKPEEIVDSTKLKPEQSEETGKGIQEKPEVKPNGLCPVSETVHELNTSEQQQEESNQLFSGKKCSFKNLEASQQQEKPIPLPSKSDSDKISPSIDQNQQTNTDLPRRQSTRKRPLTTRALEALESGFFTAKSMKSTSKQKKRERFMKIKNTANASNITQGETDNGFLVKEATSDSEPCFLVKKATTASNHVDQIEDSKKMASKFPKFPPIVLKLPFKRS